VSELETVLATLHRSAAAMAADPRPPARIRLGAAGVTLEWDLLSAGESTSDGGSAGAPAVLLPAGVTPAGAVPNGAAPLGTAAAAEQAGSPGAVATAHHVLSAPTVGVFYRASEPGAAPFVDTGDLISPGQQVGIVEAMKLMIPVEADRGGRVVDVLCADATAVEFGAPLFAVAVD